MAAYSHLREALKNERLRDCTAIVLAASLLTLLVQPFQDTPFVDDWVYAWSVERLVSAGRLEVLDLSTNLNVAQLLWGWLACLPLGFSFAALRVSTWLLAVAGLCGLYLLLRDLDVPRTDALLGTATLGVYPIFAMLSVTFMTDVPFVSLSTLAAFAMVRAQRCRSVRWLVVATAVAALAAAVRLIGVVTPIAMSLALLLGGDPWGRRRGRWALGLVPLAAVAALVYWSQSHTHHIADLTWIRNTPGDRIAMLREFGLPLLPRMIGETLALICGTLGLALLPLSIASIRRATLARVSALFVAVAAVLIALYAAGLRYALPLLTGATWALNEIGGTAPLVPDYVLPPVPDAVGWAGLALGTFSLASATASLSAARFDRTVPAGRAFLVLAIAGQCTLMALLWLIGDRYVLVLVPYAIAVLLAARPPLHRRAATIALAVVALIAAVGIRDHLSYNRALWRAVDELRQAGVPERDINGGYVVNGWLQYAHPDRAHRDAQGNVEVPWVNGANEPPYRIANSAAEGWEVLRTVRYERWLASSGHIYVLKERGGVGAYSAGAFAPAVADALP